MCFDGTRIWKMDLGGGMAFGNRSPQCGLCSRPSGKHGHVAAGTHERTPLWFEDAHPISLKFHQGHLLIILSCIDKLGLPERNLKLSSTKQGGDVQRTISKNGEALRLGMRGSDLDLSAVGRQALQFFPSLLSGPPSSLSVKYTDQLIPNVPSHN